MLRYFEREREYSRHPTSNVKNVVRTSGSMSRNIDTVQEHFSNQILIYLRNGVNSNF